MLHNFGPHAFGESRRHLISCIALKNDRITLSLAHKDVNDGDIYKKNVVDQCFDGDSK